MLLKGSTWIVDPAYLLWWLIKSYHSRQVRGGGLVLVSECDDFEYCDVTIMAS